MSGILLAIMGVFALIRVSNWWSTREQRAAEVAEIEAITLHTRPVLIRSQFIGDNGVEDRFEMVRGRLAVARNAFIGPEDVYMAIYNSRTNKGSAFIDFQMWADLEEEKHRQRVFHWEQARLQSMQIKDGEKVGLTDRGKQVFNGQRQPIKEQWTIEL